MIGRIYRAGPPDWLVGWAFAVVALAGGGWLLTYGARDLAHFIGWI